MRIALINEVSSRDKNPLVLKALQKTGNEIFNVGCTADEGSLTYIQTGLMAGIALNKGFGWAGDINLDYIFEKLFLDPPGRGYPLHRAESQQASRKLLEEISKTTHGSFDEIMKNIDAATLEAVMNHKPFKEFIDSYGKT